MKNIATDLFFLGLIEIEGVLFAKVVFHNDTTCLDGAAVILHQEEGIYIVAPGDKGYHVWYETLDGQEHVEFDMLGNKQ